MYSWRELNANIAQMGEQELIDLMDEELKSAKRTTVLVRLHQRYTMVRAARERDEMLKALARTTPSDARCSA